MSVPGLADPARYGFAQCVVAGSLVSVAGQMGLDEDFRVVSTDFEPQARRSLENVGLALEAAGASFDDVVSVTVYLTDLRNGPGFFEVRRRVMGDVVAASTTVGVSQLVFPEVLVEVQALAVLPSELSS